MTDAPSSPQAQAADPAHSPSPWRPAHNGPLVILICVLIAVVGTLAVLAAWRLPPFASPVQITEDAYVRGQTTVISPQVSGYVRQVHVADFQVVQAGQPLVEIDEALYRQKVQQAQAELEVQQAALANSVQALALRQAAQTSARAGVLAARAQLIRAQADMARADDLATDGAISTREADDTRAALRQAQAGLAQAQAAGGGAAQEVRAVLVGRGGLAAGVERARAALKAAQIDLRHTRILAPDTGALGDVGVRNGQYVTNGTPLMYLVPPVHWVTAEFKEGQTARMAPGQRAWFTVDALHGAKIHGRVERLAPAAGSEFAVLKPDNATGNFTKVAQRISVRIAIDPGQPLAARLGPGMSVEAYVDTAPERGR